MLQGTGYLPEIMPHSPLTNILLARVCLSYQLFEVTFFSPLNDYEHFILLDKAFDIPYDELMLQLFEKLHLLHTLISLFLIIHVEDLSLLTSIRGIDMRLP
jgi:hypothetical protein